MAAARSFGPRGFARRRSGRSGGLGSCTSTQSHPPFSRLRHNRSCFTPTSSGRWHPRALPSISPVRAPSIRHPIGLGWWRPLACSVLGSSWSQSVRPRTSTPGANGRRCRLHSLDSKVLRRRWATSERSSSFKTARLDGNTYTVRGVLSDLPKALVTLIFTVVTHGPNNQTGASFTPPHPNRQAKVIGRVVVNDGRVTSETFTTLEASPSRGRAARSPSGTITYSRFDSSPAIAAPTKADLNQPASPCGPTASGSCQLTTKGAAPHSALCRAMRAHGHNASAAEAIAQAQTAPKLPTMEQDQEGGARCLDARGFAGAGGRTVAALGTTQHSGCGASRDHISP